MPENGIMPKLTCDINKLRSVTEKSQKTG